MSTQQHDSPRTSTKVQAAWFVGYWLAGVVVMALVSGVLEWGMRLLR